MMDTTQKFWISGFILICGILIYFLSPVLMPFLIAGLLAYLGDPLVERLEQMKIPRTLSVGIFFLLAALIGLLFLLMLIPMLARQYEIFLNKLPDIFAWLQQTGLPWINEHLGMEEGINIQNVKATIAQHWQQAGSYASMIWKTVSHSGLTIVAWLTNLLLIPVVTFYLLRDWRKIVMAAWSLIPRRFEPMLHYLVNECNEVLGAFFRGQLIVMLLLSIFYSIGLWIAGLPLALLLGIAIGVISIVPYLGFIVGLLIAILVSLVQYHDWTHVFYVLCVFVLGHVVEGMVLTPLLVGDRIGLHPVAVIFAILAGGTLFGFIGVLLALPVAAIIKVLLAYLRQQYLQSDLYKSI